jgi:subtilisin-like proprotein convertase family protein
MRSAAVAAVGLLLLCGLPHRASGSRDDASPRTIRIPAATARPVAIMASPPNILVNDPAADVSANDTQSTTTFVLLPGNVILCAFNDSGSLAAGSHYTGIARSTNSGDVWLDQGGLPNSTQGDAGWPVYAYSAATGTVVLTTVGFDVPAILAFRSTDGGQNYLAPVDASLGALVPDREWITCDNFAGPESGNFYLLFRDFNTPGGMVFTRSINDGVSWTSKQTLASNTGQLAWVVVGADHAVYCFWLEPVGSLNRYVLRKSTDQGLTFSSPVTVATLRTTGVNGDLGLDGGFRTFDNIEVVAHPTDPDRLYAVWADKDPSLILDKANVYFSQTADGGVTWSSPVRINADATLNDQWQPVIAVSPDGTTLFTSWYDRRLDPANSLIDVYARHATILGNTVTFTGDYRITQSSFPVARGQDPNVNSVYMGDYDVAAADNMSFYRTWGDNRLADAAHTHQPDVRLARVPNGPVILSGGSTLSSEDCLPANGAPDPNETVSMNLTLANQGTGATTSLVATLQSSQGVISHSAPQNYGAMAPGGSAARSFSFTTIGSCAGTATATLQLQDGATNLGTVSFPLHLGAQTFFGPDTYSSGDLEVPIPATGTVGDMTDQIIHVSDVGDVADVNVHIRLDHSLDSDLKISLVSPSGTTVVLADRRGGSGENFGVGPNRCSGGGTLFDDEAVKSITTEPAPFTGSHRPEEPLSAFDNTPAQGDWRLKINDAATDNTGVLGCWELEIYRSQTDCNTCVAATVGDGSTTLFGAWQNEPNPFTHSTAIRYSTPAAGPVELDVFNVLGRRIATLVHEVQSAGLHAVTFGPGASTVSGERLGDIPTGVYFYRLRAGGLSTARKMVLVR